MKVLLQLPSIAQPSSMSIFMETPVPYSVRQADADVLTLASSLSAEGISVAYLTDALFSDSEPHVPIEHMRQLAKCAIRFADDVPLARRELAYEQVNCSSRRELADIIINQPKLKLHSDDEIVKISPDSTYESYEIQPLYGLVFPRDHYINVAGQPVFGHLKRQDRAREVEVVKKVVAAHGQTPVALDCALEGGDYQENKRISIINTGFRTDEQALHFLLSSNVLKTDIVLAVHDGWRNPEQFHLDHYACLLRDTLLLNTTRANAVDRSRVTVYRRESIDWRMTHQGLTLRQAALVADLEPVLLDDSMMAAWCANSFTLGDNIWIDSNAPQALLDGLSLRHYKTHLIAYNEHRKQFGGIHCSAQLL